MTLGELLENLYTEVNIELKEHDGLVICRVGSKSSGLGPYKENPIGKWFPYTKGDHTGLVVYLDKPDIEGQGANALMLQKLSPGRQKSRR